jgi:hypothetical protein
MQADPPGNGAGNSDGNQHGGAEKLQQGHPMEGATRFGLEKELGGDVVTGAPKVVSENQGIGDYDSQNREPDKSDHKTVLEFGLDYLNGPAVADLL